MATTPPEERDTMENVKLTKEELQQLQIMKQLQIVKLASRLGAIQKELMNTADMSDERYEKLLKLIEELEVN